MVTMNPDFRVQTEGVPDCLCTCEVCDEPRVILGAGKEAGCVGLAACSGRLPLCRARRRRGRPPPSHLHRAPRPSRRCRTPWPPRISSRSPSPSCRRPTPTASPSMTSSPRWSVREPTAMPRHAQLCFVRSQPSPPRPSRRRRRGERGVGARLGSRVVVKRAALG